MIIRLFGLSLLPPSCREPALMRAVVRSALGRKRSSGSGELCCVFVGRKKMAFLNKGFLRHDHDTDVIAFPYAPDSGSFGDVFVSVFQARRQALSLGHSLLEEILTLLAHGALHLVGCRDDSPRQKKEMFRKQDRILRAAGFR